MYYIRFIHAQCASWCVWKLLLYLLLTNYLTRRMYCSNGSNDVWHSDGYDKIKQYGFPIHCGVNGLLRKIVWLKVVESNNNPILPLALYLRAIKDESLCPNLLKTDCVSVCLIMVILPRYIVSWPGVICLKDMARHMQINP